MDVEIREYCVADEEAVVRLSLRAWAPVFASIEEVLGTEISTRLHGADWRNYQAKSVRDTPSRPCGPGLGRRSGLAGHRFCKADYRLFPMTRYFKAL